MKHCSAALIVCCLASHSWSSLSAQDLPAGDPRQARKFYITREAAGPDYAVQGEYSGRLAAGVKLGVQVIALGDGRFHAVAYHGGLPGDGWDGQPPMHGAGELAGDITRFTGEHGAGTIRAGVMTLVDKSGSEQGQLPRVERQSPTLGAAPPADAVVLFDGSSTKGWRGTRAREGLLQVGGQTLAEFEDFALHLEFLTPFMPHARGQDRGNSGVFLQKRYEVQILDSFGLSGADNECGAIYGFHKPALNMCYPPLCWQTFDIDFRMARFDADGKKREPARATVRHNGVVVQDQAELAGKSPVGIDETPAGGPLLLQFHGNPVQFRNIWLVPRKVAP